MPGEIQNVPPEPIAFGKYTLLERISHGGMAEVFRATTQGTGGFDRVVAIKLLLPQVANDAEFVTMLIDEAKIAGQLSHANIAQIFDLGQVDGRYYIVQEYVPGRDLRAILRYLDESHGRLGVAWACHIILKVCEALDYAHNKRDAAGQPLNLVHRDISPQNVIVSHEGEVKLIDFGIVKAEGRATRTLAGLVKGKFAYMSPEQIRGLPVDRRSDVFACGILLHELLTGQPLFKRGSEFETLQRARSGEIEPPSLRSGEVPLELDRIALKALSRHLEDRYQTAIALRDDLWDFVRASGNFQSRDQLAGWMRATFGEPSGSGLEPATSRAELRPSESLETAALRLAPSALDDDDESGSLTMVDGDLVSRLTLAIDDPDTVKADAADLLLAAMIAQGQAAGAAAPAPRLRELAEAAQNEPDRAVFVTGSRSRQGRGSDPSFDVDPAPEETPARPAPGGPGNGASASEAGPSSDQPARRSSDGSSDEPGGDEDETTSARSQRQGDAGSALWFEPQTPTRLRVRAAPDARPASDLDPDDDDQDGASSARPTLDLARSDPGAGDTGVSEARATSRFSHVDAPDPSQTAPPLGPPPPIGPPPVPLAAPDALTLGPAHNVPVPFPRAPEPPGYPRPYPPPADVPAEPAFRPTSRRSSSPAPGPGPLSRSAEPEFAPPAPPLPGLPAGPGSAGLPGLGPDALAPPGPPPGLAPPISRHGYALPPHRILSRKGADAGLPGWRIPDLRPPASRYLVAAALAVLVASVTISIVLAVTGG